MKQPVAIAQQEPPAAGEVEAGANQEISTLGEAQHQLSQVSENTSSNWPQVSESGDTQLAACEDIKAEVFGMVVEWTAQDNLFRKFWFGTCKSGRWDKSPRVNSGSGHSTESEEALGSNNEGTRVRVTEAPIAAEIT